MQEVRFNIEKNGARGDGSFDNAEAIQRTIIEARSVGGGVVSVPAGVWKTSGQHEMPSCVTIEGVSNRDFSNCRVELVGDNRYSFKIGDHSRSVHFRDIEICTSGQNNIGVLAEGKYPNSAFMTSFERVTLRGFRYGLDVRSLPGESDWECNMLRLEDVQIINGTGIRCNTTNSQFVLTNCYFKPGVGNDGLSMQKVGMLTMVGCLGVGEPGAICVGGKPNPNNARTFIHLVGERGPVSIINSPTEGMQEWMRVSTGSWLWTIDLKANAVQDRVICEAAALINSEANTYCADSFYATGAVRINSQMDALFRNLEGNIIDDCGKRTDSRTPFVLSDGALVMNQQNPLTGINESSARHIFRDPGEDYYQKNAPIATFESEVVGKALTRWGTRRHFAETSRDSNGFFQFRASQAGPHRGFGFNGALELEEDKNAQPPTEAGKIRIRFNAGKLQWAVHGGHWTDFK